MAKLDIYLLATYVARPKNPRQTSRAGYITDPNNIQYDENLSIASLAVVERIYKFLRTTSILLQDFSVETTPPPSKYAFFNSLLAAANSCLPGPSVSLLATLLSNNSASS